jgi:hypothetical protein
MSDSAEKMLAAAFKQYREGGYHEVIQCYEIEETQVIVKSLIDEIAKLKSENMSLCLAIESNYNKSTSDPCDEEIFTKGNHVAILAGANAKTIDEFVRCVSEKAKIKMDWHYVGGRANVLAIGEIEAARRALNDYRIQMF